MNPPRPGEIYFANYPIDGNARHRVIVVSREELNRGSYVVAIPMTSTHFERRSRFPNSVVFQRQEYGCTTPCVAQAEHITTFLKSELDLAAGPIATLDDRKLTEVVKAIGNVISANCAPLPTTGSPP